MQCDVRPMLSEDAEKVFNAMVSKKCHADTSFGSSPYIVFKKAKKKLVISFYSNPSTRFNMEFYTGVHNIRFDSKNICDEKMLKTLNDLIAEGKGKRVEDVVNL